MSGRASDLFGGIEAIRDRIRTHALNAMRVGGFSAQDFYDAYLKGNPNYSPERVEAILQGREELDAQTARDITKYLGMTLESVMPFLDMSRAGENAESFAEIRRCPGGDIALRFQALEDLDSDYSPAVAA
jgi:hypothetical protein